MAQFEKVSYMGFIDNDFPVMEIQAVDKKGVEKEGFLSGFRGIGFQISGSPEGNYAISSDHDFNHIRLLADVRKGQETFQNYVNDAKCRIMALLMDFMKIRTQVDVMLNKIPISIDDIGELAELWTDGFETELNHFLADMITTYTTMQLTPEHLEIIKNVKLV